MHYPQDHVAFGEDVGDVEVTGVGAAVDDAVHVEVEVVEFGEEGFVGDHLVDLGVALGEPSLQHVRWCENVKYQGCSGRRQETTDKFIDNKFNMQSTRNNSPVELGDSHLVKKNEVVFADYN